MSRLLSLKDKYAAEDFQQEIRTRQGAADLMHGKALSDASGIPYQILMRRLKSPEDFTLGELRKLIKAVHLSPLAVLQFCGYSRKEIKKFFERDPEGDLC